MFRPAFWRVVYGVLTVLFVLVSEFAGWPWPAPEVQQTHASGIQVSSRSDILSNSQPSATSNHTIALTINNSLDTVGWGAGSGGDATDTLAITFPSGFNLSNIFCKDVDVSFGGTATSIAGYFGNRATSRDCPGSATSWGLLIDTTANVLTFYTPTTVRPYIATGTQVQILVGSNATFQDTGSAWITNPATAGVYTISVGGTFGGSGNIPVSINSGVTVAATVAESLSLSVSSISALGCTADDGASVNSVSTTGPLVAFGNLSANAFYQGCHDLQVSTNAGGGYSLAVQENHAMMTAGGQFTIPDTTCDAGCSSVSSGKWVTATNYGLGHTCLDQTGHDCAGVYNLGGAGKGFRPFANVAAGTFPITSILDNFNRANENPLANGTWTCPMIGGFANLQIVSNQVDSSGGGDGSCYWSAASFGADAEAYVTISTLPSAPDCVTLMARTSGENSSSFNGYQAVYCAVSGANNDTFTLRRWLNASFVAIASGIQEASAGDSIGIEVIGTTVRMLYKPAAGSWTQILSTTNSEVSGSGHVGLSVNGQTARVDDFGGGTYTGAGVVIMSSSTPAIATGRVKYRLSVPTNQAPGTYTNTIVYTIMGTF